MSRNLWAALVFASLVCLGGSAQAQQQLQQDPFLGEQPLFDSRTQAPDVNGIPFLQQIVQAGAKLYYLGERSGLFGWFVVRQNQIQMVYVTRDQKTVVFGAMFTADGANVSGQQIRVLSARDKAIYEMINGASQQKNQIAAAGESGGFASVQGSAASGEGIVGLPAASLSPGDRLYQDLEAAAGVDLGADGPSRLMIVVAPKCPNCKGTWRELSEAVKGGKLQVRLIPVYNSLGGEEAAQAARLLRAENPLEVWEKFVNGDATALAGEADEVAMKAVAANLTLVSKWNVKGYPYLVYRNKEGKVKIVQGKPDRMAAVLLDLVR